MYHVSAQGVDERMINVHYYYFVQQNWPAVLDSKLTSISLTAQDVGV